jgi:GNAT superfamily N-acetyltransferase
MNELTISRAEPEDFPVIWEIQISAYATETLLYDYLIPPLLQTLDDAVADCRQSHVFKAVADGRIVGSVRGRLAGRTCLISRLMVLPEYRNRGIGTALLKAVEDDFSANRYELFTGARSRLNIRLYEKNGYTRFRTDPERELVYMEKCPLVAE